MRRRDYLKLTGSAVTGTAIATGSVTAFHDVIDVVDDLGADNTGKSTVDADIQPHVADGTRLEFPDGTYRIDQLVTYDVDNFAMVGTGDATLVPGDYPDDGLWIGGSFVRDLTFENFTLDTAGTSPTVGFGAYSGLVVRDITKVGTHTDASTAFGFAVWDADGYGLIENLSATDGDVYDDTVGATCVYSKGTGTITYRNCALAGWSDNGLYGSDADGDIFVRGGTYANNNIAQVRISSAGSEVRNATIRVNTGHGPEANMRGIRVSDGPGPVDVVNTDIIMTAGQGSGGIVSAFTGGRTNVRDSRIYVGEDYTTVSDHPTTSMAILADHPSQVDDYAGLYVTNTAITGGGPGGAAVLSRRGNTVVRGCCIDQSGTGRDGVVLQTPLGGNEVTASTIDVPGKTVVRNDADVTISDIDPSGSCARPESMDDSNDSTSSLDLADLPLPAGAQDDERPVTGTDPGNPTAIIYGRYTDPPMESFAGSNLQRLVSDFVTTGRLNVQYRNVPVDDASHYLSELGLGVWDLEPENYWGFVEHLLENRPTVQDGDIDTARSVLDAAGVRNSGWIPWRAANGHYADTVGEDARAAANWGMTDWSDFPPVLYFDGDIAAPQYDYEGGIKTWLERRL